MTGNMTGEMTAEKARAAAWFRELRDTIVAAFEELEESHAEGPFAAAEPGRFEVRATSRTSEDGSDAGGGLMSVMRGGRVFEKVGVNISEVYGTLSQVAQASMAARGVPGIEENPRFWASGISLVAHLHSPLVPAVHMNTRHIVTAKSWFGGGGDLNPMYEVETDTADFHAAFKEACDRHDPEYFPKFKAWCDDYFMIKHRGKPRGVGGIFFDYVDSGDWEADFAFTQDVGRAFLDIYPRIAARHIDEPWTEEQRQHQLVKRGHYAEFNLLYDRGTQFGLKTGGNVEAILMSLPPVAAWP